MSPWFIFLWVLGPFAAFTLWLVIAQLRGRFREAEPERTSPDFFQRHATIFGIALVLLAGASIAGVPGLLVSAALLLVLSLAAALIMTFVEGSRHRSQTRALQASGDEFRHLHLDPLLRRFARNFRSAITEWPGYFG